MSKQFEGWAPTLADVAIGPLAVFFNTFSSSGYYPGQVKFLQDNPEIAQQLKIEPEVIQQAVDSYDGDWDAVSPMEVLAP